MKKNLLYASQLTTTCNYMLFGPNDVKVFKNFYTSSKCVAQGHRLESIYVIFVEIAYVNKMKKNQNVDL